MKHRILILTALILLFSMVVPACSTPPASSGTPAETSPSGGVTAEPTVLNVMTHDSFSASESVISAFEQEYNVKINFIKSGDAGAALNKAILTKDAPLADVFYGVDNTFLSRALSAGIFEAYQSPGLSDIPAQFVSDPTYQALPVDYGFVCLNYDKAYFTDKNLAIPASFEDLLQPEYKGLLVVENPATSSPGLAFLLATIVHFGTDQYLDYWKGLVENGVQVADGWETAYYTNFSGSSGKGNQPLVVSYSTSPAAEVVYSETPITVSPVGIILASDMCFEQIEYVGILKGTQNLELAQKFIDFMLGTQFQEDMPLQMYVLPVNSTAGLPEVYKNNVQEPAQPAVMDPEEIAANRDSWIKDWTNAVLQ
jgi:thiamine transport system substrate-binding protein